MSNLLIKLSKILLLLLLGTSLLYSSEKTLTKEEKASLEVYLVIDPESSDPIFTRDIDNQITFSKNSYSVKRGKIQSNACLLINLSKIDFWSYLHEYWNEKDQNYFLVDSIYEEYGIKNVAKILSLDGKRALEEFAKEKGLELEVTTTCENQKRGNTVSLHKDQANVFFIPNYFYHFLAEKNNRKIKMIKNTDILITYDFDSIKKLSDEYTKLVDKKNKTEEELKIKYKEYADNKSKEITGSLYLTTDEYSNQKFCTLSYKGKDAVSVIGYRLNGDEIVTSLKLKNYLTEKKITLKYEKNSNYFSRTFDNINDAFLEIKASLENRDYDFCNFFVDYPENILKLKKAIESQTKYKPILGQLYEYKITSNKYAKNKGYSSYDEYSFAYKIDASKNQLKTLKKYGISNNDDYTKIQNEIVSSSYSTSKNIKTVLSYLKDSEDAKKKGLDVNTFKKQRLEEEKKQAKIASEKDKKRREEFAKEYPYTATLKCGMSGGSHINIVACFVGGKYSAETSLEIRNGETFNLYKPYNLMQAGNETRDGLEINLKKNFKIKAQNSHETLVLSLEIKENSTGRSMYNDAAGKYGVIHVSN